MHIEYTADNLWEILVPTTRPDGRPYHLRYHRIWDAKVREITGGLTVMSVASGQWRAPDGEIFLERMIPVRIVCTRRQMEAIMVLTMTYYEQQAVMAFHLSNRTLTLRKE